jgi:hypothetical protein
MKSRRPCRPSLDARLWWQMRSVAESAPLQGSISYETEGISMGFESDIVEGGEDREPDRQAVIMEDKLRKDVTHWSGERKEQLNKKATEAKQSAVKRLPPQPAGGSKGPIASRRAIKPAAARSKPFSMSYDGMTEAQYIQYRLDRGAR